LRGLAVHNFFLKGDDEEWLFAGPFSMLFVFRMLPVVMAKERDMNYDNYHQATTAYPLISQIGAESKMPSSP